MDSQPTIASTLSSANPPMALEDPIPLADFGQPYQRNPGNSIAKIQPRQRAKAKFDKVKPIVQSYIPGTEK